MKRLSELFLVALLAVGLSLGVMVAYGAFQNISTGLVRNIGMEQYFRDVRGYKMVAAVAGTAEDGATTTVTGMEAGDVILDVIGYAATGMTATNFDESGYTATSGGAVLDTVITEPTQGDDLIFLFADIDNTN